MSYTAPPEFYFLAEAYFHQDFATLYADVAELAADVAEGFETYGSKHALKRCLAEMTAMLSDAELEALWARTNAQVRLENGAELRRTLTHILAAL
jgi:hypothetical protein